MIIGIAADHAGFELKADLVARLEAAGHEVIDFGARRLMPEDDYPDYVAPLASAVNGGRVERGIAVCGSGIGASIAANKIGETRAVVAHETNAARQGVEYQNVNLLCLPARRIEPSEAWALTQAFLNAEPAAGAPSGGCMDKPPEP